MYLIQIIARMLTNPYKGTHHVTKSNNNNIVQSSWGQSMNNYSQNAQMLFSKTNKQSLRVIAYIKNEIGTYLIFYLSTSFMGACAIG